MGRLTKLRFYPEGCFRIGVPEFTNVWNGSGDSSDGDDQCNSVMAMWVVLCIMGLAGWDKHRKTRRDITINA